MADSSSLSRYAICAIATELCKGEAGLMRLRDINFAQALERSEPGTLTYLCTYLPTYLPSYLPTYLPAYLPTYLPTYPTTYLSTYLPVCTYACMCVCMCVCKTRNQKCL